VHEFNRINDVAIAAATLINIIIGAFWYSPAGFGKLWSKLTKINMMDMPKSEANKAIGLVAISAFVQSVILAIFIRSFGTHTIRAGITLGLLLWLGFTAATTVGDTVYAKRGWKLWWINSSFYLLVLLINAVMLSLWH
jgi:hypothetical protein